MALSKNSTPKRGVVAVVVAAVAMAMIATGLAVATVPAFAAEGAKSVVAQPDICDNLAGVQVTVPDGYAVEYGLCTTLNAIYVVAADPSYKQGTCSKVGTIVTRNTEQYTWEASGTSAATIETATPVGDVVLDGDLVYGRAVFGPYDLTKLTGDGCPITPRNASASVAVGTAQTCTDSSVETFAVTNATLSKVDGKTAMVLDKTVGDHVAVFTANTDHQFADGTTSLTLNYKVTAHKASQGTDSSVSCYVKPITPATVYQTVVWLMAPAATATITQGNITYPQKGVTQNKNLSVQTLDVAVPTTCSTKYQVDAYVQLFWNGESTTDNAAALNAMFVSGLAGPSGAQDGKFLAGAGHNPGVNGLGHAWKIVVNPDCALTPHVTVVVPTYTPGTCSVVGTVVATNTAQYTWVTSGTEAATFETATAVGNVVLDGKTIFGPYDLSKLSGDGCPSTITPTPTPTPTQTPAPTPATATTPPTTGVPGGGTDGSDIVGTHVSSSVTGGFNPFELLFAIMAGLAVGLIVWFKTWKHLPFMRKRDVSAGA